MCIALKEAARLRPTLRRRDTYPDLLAALRAVPCVPAAGHADRCRRAGVAFVAPQHEGLVWYVVRGWRSWVRPADRDDLEQAARSGLVKALLYYDPWKEVRFATVAVTYMRNEVCHHCRVYLSAGFVGASVSTAIKNGRPIVPPAVRPLSAVYEDPGRAEGLARPDPAYRAADARADARDALRRVADGRTRYVLWQHYGLGRSLRELARELGVTPERVRQLADRGRSEARRRSPAGTH